MLDNKNYRRLDFLVHACNLVNIPLEDLKITLFCIKLRGVRLLLKIQRYP